MKNCQITDPKLRVVTRKDLPSIYSSVQAGHAAIDFQHQHPEIAQKWNTRSNYLVYLTVNNEEELLSLIAKAEKKEIPYTFREPDISNEITAVALAPSDDSRKLTSSFPLLKDNKKFENEQ